MAPLVQEFISHSFKYLNTNFISENTLQTDPTWKTKEYSSIQIISRSDWDYALDPHFMCVNERVDAQVAYKGWEDANFNDGDWSHAITQTAKLKVMLVLERVWLGL
jgi:hypothetical protein